MELGTRPTLVILDNLETLADDPRRVLLDVARTWSEAEGSRVLLTTRAPDLQHPDYPLEGSHRHRPLPLAGLDPEDALEYFQKLLTFPPAPTVPPPAREGLENLFQKVEFHPLSVNLLAPLLKNPPPGRGGGTPGRAAGGKSENPLLASLNLSLDRVPAEAHQLLPRLGVFHGGALENILLWVTGLGLVDAAAPPTELAPGADPSTWPALRQILVAATLLQPETLRGARPLPQVPPHPGPRPLGPPLPG